MNPRIALAALVLLTGCGTGNTVAIDRAQLALMYADLSRPLYAACERKALTTEECAKLNEANTQVRAAIVQPKRDFDWSKFAEILGAVVKVAAKAAI